jgi:hypothetical protein
MMTVNGWKLPDAYAEFFPNNRYSSWKLKERVDAYSHPLKTDFLPIEEIELMEERTARLDYFTVDPDDRMLPPIQTEPFPGSSPDIDDFSKIVQFGRTGSGAPFCFDFRDDPQNPSVIHWEEAGSYWRRVAPNFDAFINLFEEVEVGP